MYESAFVTKRPVSSAATRLSPSKLFVETTTRCNLGCPMCVKYAPGSDIANDHMSPATFARLEGAFDELQVLILNGIGEPLLNPHLESFIATARRRMPKEGWIGFQSNGLLLDAAKADALLDAGLSGICLSLDALSPETFRRVRQGGEIVAVVDAFSALQQARQTRPEESLQVGVEFVVRQDNLQELPEVIAWAAQQGADFALVSQLMPYAAEQLEQRAYNNCNDAALTLYKKWQRIGAQQGLDLRDYPRTVWSADRNRHAALSSLVQQMKEEARLQDVFLNLQQLFDRDAEVTVMTERIFKQAQAVARREGLNLHLPALSPRHARRCSFVEEGGAFIAWNGDLHPCYNLWHNYHCYVEDWQRSVKAKVFGNLKEKSLVDLWNQNDFIDFRQNVLKHDYPYCSNCSVAPCDYVESEEFEQDCFLGKEPCGACLWSTGLLQCLQ
ncbi:MAG: radical SAM protein [Desulfuromonas sp.]|nr:MAG: radical SAM protein [Desulfuromonas sp.]